MACLVCDLPLDKDPVPERSIAIQNYSFFRLHHFIAGHRNTFAFPIQPRALRVD
jgi:hypothetical protein